MASILANNMQTGKYVIWFFLLLPILENKRYTVLEGWLQSGPLKLKVGHTSQNWAIQTSYFYFSYIQCWKHNLVRLGENGTVIWTWVVLQLTGSSSWIWAALPESGRLGESRSAITNIWVDPWTRVKSQHQGNKYIFYVLSDWLSNVPKVSECRIQRWSSTRVIYSGTQWASS